MIPGVGKSSPRSLLLTCSAAYPKGQHLYAEQRQQIAEVLYNAGYRKIRERGETLEAEIKHLNTIVERLDELLGKGINDYIMGIDGVEGLKDMWERSSVREFAGKLKEKYSLYDDRHILYRIIDELLKEYE